MDKQYSKIRALVEDYYDIQEVRVRSGNRVWAYEQGVSEQEKSSIKEMTGKALKRIEGDIRKEIQEYLETQELWTEWLVDVKGIGPVLAGGLLAYIEDIERFATISKLWRFAGQAVSEDGTAERRVKGQMLHYNSDFKSLCWKIGESFVKSKGGYRQLYEVFRQEYEEKWKTPEDCRSIGCQKAGKGECMKGHRYAAAKRKTVKVFLAHVFMKWRELKGLPEEHPFIIGRNNHEHIIPIVVK